MPERKSAKRKPKASPKKTARKKRSRATTRPSKRAPKNTHPFKSWLKKTIWWAIGGALFVMAVYLGYLDYTIRHQFEGRRWALPASVYAAPLEMYAGLKLSPDRLEGFLKQLNYRYDPHLSSQASYYRRGTRWFLRSRAFHFPDGLEPSHKVRLTLQGNRLTGLYDLQGETDLALLRLDPIQIGSFYPGRKEDRILVQSDRVPPALIESLITVEDRDFYRHHGVSPRAIARALWADIRAGHIVQGGSTLTQQLVKNFFLTSKRTLWRKANEALMALILEARYEKDEILEAYLNEIYLGQDGARAIHGFGLASEFYFSRPLDDLEIHHIALLVGLVRGPSYYDPRRHPERALKRRNLVLDLMAQAGVIDSKTLRRAKRESLEVTPHFHRPSARHPAFLDLVKRHLGLEYKEEDITSEGLKIFTTLEVAIQNTLEQTAQTTLARLEKGYRLDPLETASLVTRRDSGEIVALIGGRDPRHAGFNRALDGVRQIGSLIKPAVYLTALEQADRYTVISPLSDTPVRIKNPDGSAWRPQNYDRKSHGQVPLHQALAHSYNLATIHLGMDLGLDHVAQTVRRLGVSRPLKLYPSMLLGAASMTPLEVTQMYQTLANQGFATPLRVIRAVLANDNQPLQRYPLTIRQTVDAAPVYLLNTILQEVVREGTGRSAYRILPDRMQVAGKTGTTDDLRDSWFAGFSGDYLAVTWIGRDDNLPTKLTGATGALQLWAKLMGQISERPLSLNPPDTVEWVWIDPDTGSLADADCPGADRFPFVEGTAPKENAPCVRQPEPASIRGWFKNLF
ncbi:penicillin-binding protein 1B [Methylohalobius crimeensis]|uniref:penicillin-binding protein 1B n=1 Tax=Methylohalobius crimeensis TaxID=244365 RepID=UPI0003B6BE36|nr:penicillin-binding protein 1B [Methylohalobius crimeensis]